MTAELPDNLHSLDDELMNALSVYAPPKDLDAKILDHVSRRTRLRLVPSPLMVKSAAAVVAIGLVAGVGYVADRQMGGEPVSLVQEFTTQVDALYAGVQNSVTSAVQADEKPIPYSDLLTYPKVWPDLSARSEQTAREEGKALSSTTTTKSSASHDQDGQNVLYADGHATFEKEPYSLRSQNNQSRGQPLDGDTRTLRPTEDELPVVAPAVVQNESSIKAARTPVLTYDSKWRAVKEEGRDSGLGDQPVELEKGLRSTTSTNAPASGAGGGGAGKLGDRYDATALHFKPTVPNANERMSRVGKEAGVQANVGLGIPEATDDDATLDRAKKQLPLTEKQNVDASGAMRLVDAGGQASANTQQQAPVVVRQKVIRNGVVEFEVDSFDTALMTITKLVVEQGGFVASTDSAKLPNGKTRGAVTLRIPPERLDTFVLMLRGIGDLKSQKISAQDVSKQYTDIESQLKAARAMEERLLEMIKKGQGAIKDLLAAEKELGVWREKIEKLEGEKRYYDNLISLSTLTVTLQERDIKASAATVETESISAGVETDDVEKARAEIIKSIDEAKGRIISSDLKKLDAGQFASTIVAEVAPDRAGPVVDRLKQLGKVARLDVDRKQTTVDGTSTPVPGAHVEKKPTTLTISLYNLANVAPRLTTSATLASDNVEENYRQIMAIVEKAGGRVVASQLQRPQPDQVQATLQIEVPSAEAAATQAAVQALGETMNLQLSENPDTANVTTAKQGFSLRMISTASVPARETSTLQLAAKDVAEAHRALQAVAEASGARIVQSNVVEGDRDNVNAVLQLDIPRDRLDTWQKAQSAAGEVLTRSVVRSSDTQNTLDSKVRLSVSIYPVDKLPPRQTTSASLHVGSAESTQQTFLAQATQLGGRVIDQSVSRDANGRSNARVVFDVPRDQAGQIITDLRSAGEIWAMNTSTNAQAPDGSLSRTRFDLQFSEGEALVGPDDGVWSSIKAGLATSLQGLGWSVRLLVIGVCLVAPWVLVLWGAWKLVRRRTKPQLTSGV